MKDLNHNLNDIRHRIEEAIQNNDQEALNILTKNFPNLVNHLQRKPETMKILQDKIDQCKNKIAACDEFEALQNKNDKKSLPAEYFKKLKALKQSRTATKEFLAFLEKQMIRVQNGGIRERKMIRDLLKF